MCKNCQWLESNLSPLVSEVTTQPTMPQTLPECCLKRIGKNLITNYLRRGGSPGLMVMGGDSRSKCCGFESRHHILDGHFFTYICCKNCNVCLKRLKINEKEAGVGPFKKRKVVQTSSKNTVISNLFNFASQDSSSPFIFSGKLTSRSPPTNQIFEINLSNLNRN